MHLSRLEAAQYVGVSLSSLDNLVRAGRIPHVRPTPRRVVFRVKDLDAYVASQLVQPVVSRRRGVRRTRKHPA